MIQSNWIMEQNILEPKGKDMKNQYTKPIVQNPMSGKEEKSFGTILGSFFKNLIYGSKSEQKSKSKKKYVCYLCGHGFDTVSTLNQHKQTQCKPRV